MTHGGKAGRVPRFWDGRAAERIAAATLAWMQKGCKPA
jgi:UDP-N-acetylglucosamine 2-epimerase (non-hydrolysing)